jgi:predicted phage gp36 major capsid-like protein
MQPLAKRVDNLEERVTRLEELPARVDALTLQISQLRDEMRMEFSAVRGENRTADEETRRSLREEIHAGGERILNQARMLHEEVLSRLALIEESRPRRNKRR